MRIDDFYDFFFWEWCIDDLFWRFFFVVVVLKLVSGGSGTEASDEKANSADDETPKAADGYTEGIPGPVTRLFVLANRGLSNLVQDLILVSWLKFLDYKVWLIFFMFDYRELLKPVNV